MKTTGYYTPGNPKRDRTPSREWVRRAVEKAYTQQEWIEKFKTDLPFKDQFEALLRVQPKLNISESNGLQVILNLNGVDIRPIEGQVISDRRALTDGDDDHKM